MGTKKIVAFLMKFDGKEMDHVHQDLDGPGRAQVASENITLYLHFFKILFFKYYKVVHSIARDIVKAKYSFRRFLEPSYMT